MWMEWLLQQAEEAPVRLGAGLETTVDLSLHPVVNEHPHQAVGPYITYVAPRDTGNQQPEADDGRSNCLCSKDGEK